MKLFDEFGVEDCKIVLIEEYPCQNRKQLEREKVNRLKMIRTVLTDVLVLLVGLKGNITMPQESITLTRRKDTKYSNREY